jgi:hypothetical protein
MSPQWGWCFCYFVCYNHVTPTELKIECILCYNHDEPTALFFDHNMTKSLLFNAIQQCIAIFEEFGEAFDG